MRVTTVTYVNPAQELLNQWGAERTHDSHNNVNRLTDVNGVKTRESREWVIVSEVKLTDAETHETLYLLNNRRTNVPMIAAFADMGNTY